MLLDLKMESSISLSSSGLLRSPPLHPPLVSSAKSGGSWNQRLCFFQDYSIPVMDISDRLFALLYGISVLCSAGLWIGGIVMLHITEIKCVPFMKWHLIVFGLPVFIATCCNIVTSNYHRLRTYFIIVLLLLSFILAFNISFAIWIGEPNKFSDWLVTSLKAWDSMQKCMVREHYCMIRPMDSHSVNYLRAGCCMPPKVCNFDYDGGPTRWIEGNGTNFSANPDCSVWSLKQHILCYPCHSCRVGVMQRLKWIWIVADIIIGVVCMLPIVVSYGIRYYYARY